eukprot:gene32319-39906_t
MDFEDTGVYTGLGEYRYPNGDVYTGEYLNGKKHGHGRYKYAPDSSTGESVIFEGEYANGKKIHFKVDEEHGCLGSNASYDRILLVQAIVDGFELIANLCSGAGNTSENPPFSVDTSSSLTAATTPIKSAPQSPSHINTSSTSPNSFARSNSMKPTTPGRPPLATRSTSSHSLFSSGLSNSQSTSSVADSIAGMHILSQSIDEGDEVVSVASSVASSRDEYDPLFTLSTSVDHEEPVQQKVEDKTVIGQNGSRKHE